MEVRKQAGRVSRTLKFISDASRPLSCISLILYHIPHPNTFWLFQNLTRRDFYDVDVSGGADAEHAGEDVL